MTTGADIPNAHFTQQVELRPIGSHIIARPLSQERKTKSGIILPSNDRARPNLAEVLAVGKGRISEHNVLLEVPLKKGETIIYARHSGTEVKSGDREAVLILEMDDVLAVVEPDVPF